MAGGEIDVAEHDTSVSMSEDSRKEEDMDADENGEEDSDADDNDSEDEKEEKVQSLESEVTKNPYLYDKHVELISALKEAGELDRLRSAREAMSSVFPLSEELWLAWLRDEINLASSGTNTERDKVEHLFDRAVKDYLSVPVWLEYVQYAIGGMGKEDGIAHVRDVFERALTATGLHVSKGSMLWEAYREFEAVILSGLMPPAGSVPTKEQEQKFIQQNNRVISLFKRQLSIPLSNLSETYAEFCDWIPEKEVDTRIKTVCGKAVIKLNKIKPYEDDLLSSPAPHLDRYQNYLKYELTENDPSRIQCLFERALQENCLVPDLWLQYTNYLDRKLKVKSLIMSVYERAVRNCPWNATLWQKYVLALERYNEPFEKVKEVIDGALQCGLTEAGDFLLLWTSYCDYLKRRIDWTADHTQELEDFRSTIERAVDHLVEYFGYDGDPSCSLKQFWAFVEAKFCKNLEKARELWGSIMAEGHGNEAVMWLEYLKLERCYGDSKHCRKLLQRALNSVSDWPESAVEAYLNFERQEGTFETYDQALIKCEAQMERVTERRAAAAEKETLKDESTKTWDRNEKKFKKDVKGKVNTKNTDNKQTKPEATIKTTDKQFVERNETEIKPYKRKLTGSGDAQGTGFKAPTSVPAASSEPPVKKLKEEATVPVHTHDSSKESRTVFVSNLVYSIEEEQLQQIFSKCGEITEVRVPRNVKGKPKGFGYVEFQREESVSKALAMDREPVEGRPMYVSPSVDRTKNPGQFRFSTDIEKNKLFIKGLPFTCSKEALENIFSQHGALKSVRLVTHKSGAPKGLAYVEFENENDASQAVLKTDGLQIADHTISVAISNPPQRRAPMKSRTDTFTPSLGSGKKESEFRGKARTQVSLLPRSLQKKPSGNTPTQKQQTIEQEDLKSNTELSTEKTENSSNSKMSNNDFRSMLLKK